MIKLDQVDRQILHILQRDAKATIKDIGLRLNLSSTPIFERIKKMNTAGLIVKHVTLINPDLVERSLCVFVHISIIDHSKQAIDAFVDQINEFDEVLECHHVSGKSDFLMKMRHKDISTYNDFVLEKISIVPNIANIETSFSLSVRKYTTALPL